MKTNNHTAPDATYLRVNPIRKCTEDQREAKRDKSIARSKK